MSVKEPWRLTASEALPLLRKGDLKVEDYARSLLDRIQRRDQAVKAWVWLNPSHILQQAKKLDDVPAAERGPLHGLPIGVKDVILTKDMPTQYNSKLFESEDPSGVDANVIMSLRAMGALIVGKTCTTEFACSKQGHHHQNISQNAHDPGRTPGGSSSGSGAAVGDYQVPVALGTQTGGSIVRPASFNGCYGFKPTFGAISREGLGQWCFTLDTCGFFCRSVDDLEILSDAFRIQDDTESPNEPFKIDGAKIGFFKSPYWSNAGQGTKNAWSKAQEILKAYGASIEDIESPKDFDKVLDWHADVLAGEGRTSFLGHDLLDSDRTALGDDIRRNVENRRNVSRKAQLVAYDNCSRLRPIWDDLASHYDLILTPSVVDEAPEGLDWTGDMSFCSSWTILHVPALNIPGFSGEHGFPIGLTAVGARFSDRRLLHVAKAVGALFEQEGGWKAKNV